MNKRKNSQGQNNLRESTLQDFRTFIVNMKEKRKKSANPTASESSKNRNNFSKGLGFAE
jgi:hypothetical protein